MKRLVDLKVQGYKSLADVTLTSLGPINVLIGANGAGKSNLISFFDLFSSMMQDRLQQFVAVQGGGNAILTHGAKATPQCQAELLFDFDEPSRAARYSMVLPHCPPDTLFFFDELLVIESRHSHDLHYGFPLGGGHHESRLPTYDVKLFGRTAWRPPEKPGTTETPSDVLRFVERVSLETRSAISTYHFHDTSTQAPVRLKGNLADNRRLRGDAGNLASYLYALRQGKRAHYQRVVDTVRQVLPQFDDFDVAPDRLDPTSIQLNWRECGSDYVFGPHQLSDGSLRALALITLLLQPEEDMSDILIIDEPELGLHPVALAVIASLVRGAATRRQVILATQSPPLVDHFAPEEIIVADRGKRGTEFKRLSADALHEWLDAFRLSDLWEKNVLGARPR